MLKTGSGTVLRRSAGVILAHLIGWLVALALTAFFTLWIMHAFLGMPLGCPAGQHLETFGMPGIACTREHP